MADEPAGGGVTATTTTTAPGTIGGPAAPDAGAAPKVVETEAPKLGADGKPLAAAPEPKLGADGKPIPEAPAGLDLKAIKLPEGFTLDEKLAGEFSNLLTDAKLSPQDRGQKLIDLHSATLKAAVEAPYKLWSDTQATWVKEVAADKDFGSGDLKEPLKTEVKEAISKVIDQYGGQPLRDALALTGAGNNPAIIRAFAQMSKLLTEGKPVRGGNPPAPSKSPAERMYPHLTKV